MSNFKKLMMASAGGEVLNVEDVFSTYLYTGNGSTQTITNGIDLAGEGGLVWKKVRSNTYPHELTDSERGVNVRLSTNYTDAETTPSDTFSFNSDGFSLDYQTGWGNLSGQSYVSWTFRKAPKFFDVVTYTGDGVAGRQIAHNLGSVPGCFILKATSTTGDWIVYHRGLSDPSNKALALNLTNAEFDNTYFNDTDPTATHFVVGGQGLGINNSGVSYVAYLFAHNDGDAEFGPNGDADIIKCGSYTGTSSSSTINQIDLGFEPQWLLIKGATYATNWQIYDNMRGIVTGGNDARIYADSNVAETNSGQVDINATGFAPASGSFETNYQDKTYIYIAIRRGPMAVPESASDVFNLFATSSGVVSSGPKYDFADMLISARRSVAYANRVVDRLRGVPKVGSTGYFLNTQSTAAEASYTGSIAAGNSTENTFASVDNGLYAALGGTGGGVSYAFRRAPNFFDIVAYTGTFSTRTVPHNLGVAPELMIVKKRSSATNSNWIVYVGDGTTYLVLDATSPLQSNNVFWQNTDATASSFTVGESVLTNESGQTYIAYLFASLDGVSKVGSYTGNGTTQNIDCGFSAGARFVIIKRTDVSENWHVFDTARGINSGDDPAIRLDTDASEFNSAAINPYSAGFQVEQSASCNNNVNNGSYIFYAIA